MLWLDALTANVDRSWRNPNLLVWHGDLWAIDHGACLYFHHGWSGGIGSAGAVRAPALRRLRPRARRRTATGSPTPTRSSPPQVTRDLLGDVLALVPDEWLEPVPGAATPDDLRAAYVELPAGPGRAATAPGSRSAGAA